MRAGSASCRSPGWLWRAASLSQAATGFRAVAPRCARLNRSPGRPQWAGRTRCARAAAPSRLPSGCRWTGSGGGAAPALSPLARSTCTRTRCASYPLVRWEKHSMGEMAGSQYLTSLTPRAGARAAATPPQTSGCPTSANGGGARSAQSSTLAPPATAGAAVLLHSPLRHQIDGVQVQWTGLLHLSLWYRVRDGRDGPSGLTVPEMARHRVFEHEAALRGLQPEMPELWVRLNPPHMPSPPRQRRMRPAGSVNRATRVEPPAPLAAVQVADRAQAAVVRRVCQRPPGGCQQAEADQAGRDRPGWVLACTLQPCPLHLHVISLVPQTSLWCHRVRSTQALLARDAVWGQ